MLLSISPGMAVLLGLAAGLLGLAVIYVVTRVLRPWAMANGAGFPLSFVQILGMHLRGSPPDTVVLAYIALGKLGVAVPIEEVEAEYLAHPEATRSFGDLVERLRGRAQVAGRLMNS